MTSHTNFILAMEEGKRVGLPMRVITHKHPSVSFFPLLDSPAKAKAYPGPVLVYCSLWGIFLPLKANDNVYCSRKKNKKDSNCLYLVQRQ